VSSNSASFYAGGARFGTLRNCLLYSNSCAFEGGGAYAGVFYNCAFTSNSATFGAGADSVTASNCVFNGNSASQGGGAYRSLCFSSVFSNNTAVFGGGALDGALINCLILSNSSSFIGGGADGANLTNCTLVGNSAANSGAGASAGTLYNCLLFYNTAPSGSNFDTSTLNYCCTAPLPSSGAGNITNEPLFVNLADGDFRLQSNSPCINAGYNGAVGFSSDLDGNTRVVGGTVDIGAYEFQSPSSLISYAWLQQFGLPTDGSADFIDSDSDGMNNWQEWVAGTDPTNPRSSLAMLSPTVSGTNIVVRWQSVSARKYFLQRATDLSVQPTFLTLATNITGQAGTTSYIDKQAPGYGPFFYRVGIQR
jgi:hypothetical protein